MAATRPRSGSSCACQVSLSQTWDTFSFASAAVQITSTEMGRVVLQVGIDNRFHRSKFGRGPVRRFIDWCDWMQPEVSRRDLGA
eukprot:89635-Rhodomonas_salina.3